MWLNVIYSFCCRHLHFSAATAQTPDKWPQDHTWADFRTYVVMIQSVPSDQWLHILKESKWLALRKNRISTLALISCSRAAHLPGKTCILYSSLSFSVRSPWHAAPRSHIQSNMKCTWLSVLEQSLLCKLELRRCMTEVLARILGLGAWMPGCLVSKPLP